MARLAYRDWIFDCDVEATRKAHDGIDFGGAEACDCHLCRNFLLTRPEVFPAEILDLFVRLGIDHKKKPSRITSLRLRPDCIFTERGIISSGKLFSNLIRPQS